MNLIRNGGLSAAIFAPGWTHEYFGPNTFRILEDLFWAQLYPYLYVHLPIYDDETFRTTFCRGAGTKFFSNGRVRAKKPRHSSSNTWYRVGSSRPLNYPLYISVGFRYGYHASLKRRRYRRKDIVLQFGIPRNAGVGSRAVSAIYAIQQTGHRR